MKKTISIRTIKDIVLCVACVLALFGVIAAVCAAFPVDKVKKLDGIQINADKTLNEWLDGATDEKTYVMTENVVLQTSETGETTINADQGKTVTVDGNGATLIVQGTGNGVIKGGNDSTIVLQNMIIQDDTTGGYYNDYLGFSGNIVFENCVINDPVFLTENVNARFENCEITCNLPAHYAVWLVDGDAIFENCFFKGTRALKIHEFGVGNEVLSLGVYGCTFYQLSEKVGIVIGDLTVAPKNTVIEAVNNVFNECLAWDSIGSLDGVDGFWESDTLLSEFYFGRVNNSVKFTPSVYKIAYRAVHNGKTVTDVHEAFFVDGKSYPTSYIYGKGAIVSDLKTIIYVSAYEDRTFQGWYLDNSCTIPFDGTIDKTTRGHIVLYAKIDVAKWTPNF